MADDDKPRIIGGRLIKSSVDLPPVGGEKPALGPPPRRPGVVSSEDFEAKQGANKIITDAHKQAEEIIADANRKKDEIFKKAAADARAEVMAKATEELARAKMQAGQMIKTVELDLVDLALKISAKIIGRDLQRDPGVVAEIAATAIEHARASKA